MRCCNENDGIVPRYSIRRSRVDFAEEEIYNDVERPEYEVVDDVVKPRAACHDSNLHRLSAYDWVWLLAVWHLSTRVHRPHLVLGARRKR